MGKSNYKKSCFENCKKNYIKIQQNKFGLCLFLIFSSVLVDFFIFDYLLKFLVWITSVFFGYSNKMFVLIFFICLVIAISITFLGFIYKIKNNNSKIGTEYRFIVDLIFIFELLILSIYNIVLLLKMIYKYLFAINLAEWKNVIVMFFTIILIIYIFNSMLKNILKISYLVTILATFLIFLAGWISIQNYAFISLILIVVNQFMSYEDVTNMYGKLKSNIHYRLINISKTKQQLAFNKLYFNIFIVFLYIYIALTEDFKFFEFIYINLMSKGKDISKLLLIFYRGCDRIIIIEIIVIIYAICLKVKKKSIKEEMIKFKQKFEYILMKFMEKYIIRTK